jgi:hypothetical protein
MEFRNRVIHNASWPARPETLDFGEYVCKAILGMHEALGPKMFALLATQEEQADLAAVQDLAAGREPAATLMRPTFLSAVGSSSTFEEAPIRFAKSGWWKWPVGPRPAPSHRGGG